jgi:hypothetical protein
VATTNSRNTVVGLDFLSRSVQTSNQRAAVTATQGWVRFPGRAKVGLDSKVDLYTTAGEPASAALRQLRRFWDFSHAEDRAIERSRRVFSSNWHGELDVIDAGEWMRGHER